METKYATLRRPKRKLCYLTSNERASKQWAGALSLGDIDKMFDDLEPSSHEDDDLIPPSSLLQNSDSDTNQGEREAPPISQPERQLTGEKPPVRLMGPDGDVLHPATRSLSPELDIDFPFKAHRPVKTSSPIEKNVVVEGVEELDNEKNGVVSPILFPCEDEGEETAKTDPLPIQKPHCNKHITEHDDSELESPPSKIALSKLKMSSHKNKVAGSCSENTDALVSAVRQEPEVAIHKKKSKNVLRQPSVEVSRVGKDMTTFLQKLRDAAQPKPACSRKSLSPVKVPAPPEPEDDFLILEDETPLWFSIPRKTATSKKQGQSRTSSTDKDSSTDKGAKSSPQKTTQKQQESDQANGKLGSQTVSQKIKKMKGKEKMNEVTEPGNDMNELCSPEDLSAGDLVEQEKPSKKTRLKKVASKHSDKAEEQPKESASRETDKEEPPLKMEKKTQKSLKDGNENGQTRRAKSLKGARKDTQGSGAVKERVHVEAVKGQSEEHANAEDLCSLSEIMSSEAEMDEKDNQNQLPAVSEESSSEDGQIVRKRKRRQPGQWWMSCSQGTEETKARNKQPTPKKSKQNKKEPSAAVLSRVKTKKDRVLKKINPTQPAPSSSQTTKQANEKQTKQNKNRSTRGETPEKQQQKEQEQEQVLDLDPVHCSPLVLPHRDHSLNSGDQVFQRVYRHASNEKLSITPVPQGREQLRAEEPEKRRRNPPSNWWMVNGTTEDMKSISSQDGQQEPKPRKERKKQFKQSRSPGLGTPKNGNMVSSKPPEGAPVTPLKVKPLLAPKSVKRSLATFKDIFTSAIETPIVTSSREAGQNNRHKVTECPAVEVTVTDCTTTGKTDEDILSMDAGESNSLPNHEDPQDSKCQPESMSKAHRSGPSSMIVLEQYEENEDLNVPSTRVSAVLSASDLCGPPLKPLILQPKDKANLTEWFKSLWSTTVDNGHEITPDQFDWYFYQGRAIGFLVDLNCGSICNGKILLGSYMKKPLWVDHSATTVFNLLTSSVSVIVNGCESRFSPGQSFMVPCGHAYSIQNVTAQPAVVYFTRIVAESSD
uniref:protein piccolo isoform X2 n=1 Tax=Scatophagus argus TaxID=75038 RepID=UPI001ED8195E|nr:protein piccolo isoform X2 [Scatophagus argus]